MLIRNRDQSTDGFFSRHFQDTSAIVSTAPPSELIPNLLHVLPHLPLGAWIPKEIRGMEGRHQLDAPKLHESTP
jgi:hypothetical protein